MSKGNIILEKLEEKGLISNLPTIPKTFEALDRFDEAYKLLKGNLELHPDPWHGGQRRGELVKALAGSVG